MRYELQGGDPPDDDDDDLDDLADPDDDEADEEKKHLPPADPDAEPAVGDPTDKEPAD